VGQHEIVVFSCDTHVQRTIASKLTVSHLFSLFLVQHSWFRHSKYSSFQRQLNIYGFTRIHQGIDKNAYYHDNFIQGDYHRTLQIGRHPIKRIVADRQEPDRNKAPNFYRDKASSLAPEEHSFDAANEMDVRGSLVSAAASPVSFALKTLLLNRQGSGAVIPQADPLFTIGVDSAPVLTPSGFSILPTSPYTRSALGANPSWSDTTLSTLSSGSLVANLSLRTLEMYANASSISSLLGGDLRHRLVIPQTTEDPYTLRAAERAWQAQALLDALRRSNQSTRTDMIAHCRPSSSDPTLTLRSLLGIPDDHPCTSGN
jgi:HSF-type DNA-binding